MSKSCDYTFYKSEELFNWGGDIISRDLCNKLQIGDIVRLCLCFSQNTWFKYYFEITKIDYYKYGNTFKIRKFHGKVMDTYVNDWYVIGPNHTTTFRKEDIFEIPGWKTNHNPLKQQTNFHIINQEINRQHKIDYMRFEYEYELEKQKKLKLKQSQRNL